MNKITVVCKNNVLHCTALILLLFFVSIHLADAQASGLRQITQNNARIIFSTDKKIAYHSGNSTITFGRKVDAFSSGRVISFRPEPFFSGRNKTNALESRFRSSGSRSFGKQAHRTYLFNNRIPDGVFLPWKPAGGYVVSYSERIPFEETDQSLIGSSPSTGGSVIMRATNEGDPDFPGDPGQMPVPDGAWFLMGIAVAYAIYKKNLMFIIKKIKI